MVKYVKASRENASEYLWTAVCTGNINQVKKYYENGGMPNRKYPRFGTDHSLIMGAVRNRNFEMANLLADYGENVSKEEAREILSILGNAQLDLETKSAYGINTDTLLETIDGLNELVHKLGI